ncbi:MAG: Coronin-like protein crn1 [Stictis urceolatum]|nr:Coronin-like protein crn1 [Stictis urceolata]
MAGRFVRASKYRHVFGRSTRKEQCYDNIRISKNAWDTNLVKANPQYVAVNWDASGGGAFAVIPLDEKGKLPEQLPLFRGHTAVVLDTDWHPFNDSIIASGSDDGKAFLWRVPDDFTLQAEDEITDVAPIAKFTGHSRKVGHVLFNPSANNTLATSSGDFTVKIWDIEAGSPRVTLKQHDIVQSLSWSANGSMLVTTCRDKKLRLWDVRQEKPVHVGPGHSGAKNSRVVWMGEHDRIATTGFSKMSDRQLGLWDIRNADAPINGFDMLDSISGICMPFWDDSTKCLYLAGKGDGNIRYFEYENDKFEYLSEYKSPDPQRGIAFMPKRGVNIHENEVMRAFKTINDSYIEPISFIVPRRAEVFQDDIFPPVSGTKPGMSSQEYFDGKDAIPPKIDMASLYAGEEPREVSSDYKPSAPITPTPVTAPAPAPTATSVSAPEAKNLDSVQETPQTSAAMRAAPSIKEQGASISTMAAKFADNEEEESSSAESSFEEVQKPIEKASAKQETTPPASKAVPAAPAKVAPAMWKGPSTTTTVTDAQSSAALPILNGAELAEIKSLLQQQKVSMAAQSEMIVQLTSEVDQVKRGIAALEKELAASRD